jgi:hypothetical protein
MKNKVKSTKLSLLALIVGLSFTQLDLQGQATGGTVSISGTRRIHKFTATGSLAYLSLTDTIKNVKFTVVGGGGQGGGSKSSPGAGDGAGGGGGGVYDISSPSPSNWVGLSFVINSVGSGGNSATASTTGATGGFTEVTWNSLAYFATGGVGGAFGDKATDVGGASGGYGTRASSSGTTPTATVNGNTGANGASKYMGGGGGFGAQGSVGVVNGGTRTGGAGGVGVSSSSDGLVYGSGGGGSGGTTGGVGGTNAASGGGNSTKGGDAAAGFGGGGGGTDGIASSNGGAGGSGSVILSYDAYDIYNSIANAVYNSSRFVNGGATSGIKKCFRGNFTTTVNSASGNATFGSTDIVVIESGHNLTISNGGTLTCGAIWINTGATLTLDGGTINCGPITNNGAITYTSGTINATYSTTGYTIPATTFGNLSITAGTATAVGSVTVTGVLTIASTCTLDMAGYSLTNTAGTISNSGILKTSSTSNPAFSTTTTSITGTVQFAASTGGQFIPAKTYAILTLSNSSGTNTATGAVTSIGALTIPASTILDMSTFSLTCSAGFTNNGTLKTSTTTNPAFSTTATSINGTVEFAASAGGQFIPNKSYTNLTMGNTSGTNTLIGSTIVTGVLSTANSAGNLALGNHWLTVARFSGPGHITGSANARITYTGSTASFLYMDSTSATTNNKLRRLTLSSNANLSLGNTLSIDGHYNNKDTGEVVLNTGATLTSNIVGTASARLRLNYTDTTNRAHPNIYIGHTSGASIGKVVGEIYIQDFLQGGFDKRYRQWGHPLDSTAGMSLNQFSDEIDCFGVVMSPDNSGRGSGKNINGLYQSQTTPTIINNSIFKYDESQYGTASRWVPFTSSGSTLYLEKGLGYMFVMRPSGSSTGGGTSATAPQFVGIEGQMNFANVTVTGLKISSTLKSAGTGGYNLLSNPYPTHLDLSTFFNDNTNLNTTFYKYNKASKNYETYTKGTSNWSKGANTINPIIEPMDAFWVQLNNSGTPTTDANFKITQTTILSNSSGVDRTNKLEIDSTHYLNVGIKLTTQNDASVNDEAALYLGYNESDLSYKFRSGDATKLSGTCNELNIQSVSGEKLATKSLDLRRDWSVPLNIKVCKLGVYDFVFDVVTNVDLSKYDIEFYDKLTGKSTPIVVGQNIKVDINSVANEFIEGRFFISLKNSQAKINTVGNTTGVILYPNPVSKTDVAHISILNNEKGNVQLMDSRGKVIMSQYYNGFSETVNIDLKKYSICEGIYFVSFKSESSNQTIKLSIF